MADASGAIDAALEAAAQAFYAHACSQVGSNGYTWETEPDADRIRAACAAAIKAAAIARAGQPPAETQGGNRG